MASRYKEEYDYKTYLFTDKKYDWSCIIIDRQTEEWVGNSFGHDTKQAAKEAAWDNFYTNRQRRKEDDLREREEKKREEENKYNYIEKYESNEDEYEYEEVEDSDTNGYFPVFNNGFQIQLFIDLNARQERMTEEARIINEEIENLSENSQTAKVIGCFEVIEYEDSITSVYLTYQNIYDSCKFKGYTKKEVRYILGRFIRVGCLQAVSVCEDYTQTTYKINHDNKLAELIVERRDEITELWGLLGGKPIHQHYTEINRLMNLYKEYL